jgi:GH24 family phage-related lysozyme (muramidase)
MPYHFLTDDAVLTAIRDIRGASFDPASLYSPNSFGSTPDADLKDTKYGLRIDGTPKGEGFLGLLPMEDGRVMSELSVGVEFDGKETLIPSIVPTLSQEEIAWLAGGGDSRTSDSIMDKAEAHARKRLKLGLPVFHEPFFEQTGSALDDLFLESIETTEESSQKGLSPRGLRKLGGREGLEKIKTNLIKDEGSRNYVYKDTKGYWTTGVGSLIGEGSDRDLNASEFKNIERRENSLTKKIIKNKGNYLTQDKIDTLFQRDFNKHIASAQLTPGWGKADSAQRNALINLDFNMGKWWAKVYKEGDTIPDGKEVGDLVWPKARAVLDKIENAAVEDVTQDDWGDLAKELKDSTWFTEVGDSRSRRVLNDIQGVGYSPPGYTVQAGDTLWDIANRYSTTLDVLEGLNPGLDRRRPIQIGQELNVRP